MRTRALDSPQQIGYNHPYVGVWRSSVARTVRDGEVVCSNHITPTKQEIAL